MSHDLIFDQKGHLGLITLNRPNALNALTLSMILELQNQLIQWKSDNSIHAVVIRNNPDHAFCAGGDIRWLYDAGKSKNLKQIDFFWHEYRLNHYIHHLGKPYIAFMDGMTMGGGVGVSMHGSHSVATERFIFAMPETGIGFFPDIGASHILTRCPGFLGIYLGLTGSRLGPNEALQAGLAKYSITSIQIDVVLEQLSQLDLSIDSYARVDECLQTYSVRPSKETQPVTSLIAKHFSHTSVELIIQSLQAAQEKDMLHLLEKKSPLSLKVTFTQLTKAKGMTLAECLKMDYKLVRHFMGDHDFYEGVRALLIDKDKNPQWVPKSLDLVSESMVVNYFEQSEAELELLC